MTEEIATAIAAGETKRLRSLGLTSKTVNNIVSLNSYPSYLQTRLYRSPHSPANRLLPQFSVRPL
jgi:hypothetical protein